MLLKCGEQYRRRYIEGEIMIPSAAMTLGGSGHKAEEKNFKQKIKSKTDISSEEVIDCFSDEWESRKYQIGWTKDDLAGKPIKKAEAREKDRGISLVQIFHKEQAPSIQPALVEEKFEVKFEGGYPDLLGYLDTVDIKDTLYDYKYSKRSPDKNDIIFDLQMTNYDFGFRAKFKRKPKKLKKIWSVSTKVPKTVFQEVAPRDDSQINRFMLRLEKAMEVIDKEILLPAPVGVWWCSENWCGYWNTCKVRP